MESTMNSKIPNSYSKLGFVLRTIVYFTRHLPPFKGFRYLAKKISKFCAPRIKGEFVINVLGFRMKLTPRQRVIDAWFLFHPQQYDDREICFLQRYVKPGDTFLDMGAHVGFYSLVFSRIVGKKGMVVSVEAEPNTFQRLKENIALSGADNVIAYQLGVSDKNETLSLHVSQKDSSSSSFLDFNRLDIKDRVNVDCVPLLEILRRAAVTNIDCLKLDIEGFEYRVLKEFFENASLGLYPRYLIIEYILAFQDMAGGNVLDLIMKTGRYELVFNKTYNYIFQLTSVKMRVTQ